MEFTPPDTDAENGKEVHTQTPILKINSTNKNQTGDFSKDLAVTLIDQDHAPPTFATQVQQIKQNNLSNNDGLSETGTQDDTKTNSTKGRKKNPKEEHESKVYRCNICSKEFLSKSGAKFHEKYQHIEAKLFCLICKKPFKFHYDLDRHMKTHTGHRPFECQNCDKTFVCKSSLMQHVRLKHTVGNIYDCSLCDKSFCTEADLTRHEAVHSNNKPFKCDKCTKTFTCKSSLNVHKKTHLGKKYACQFCNMHFHMQTDLQRHVTIHTGERPWRCKLCTKGYSCKSTLTVHIKHSHTKHPTPDLYIHKKHTDGDDESKGNDEEYDSSSSEEGGSEFDNVVIEISNDFYDSEMDVDADSSEDNLLTSGSSKDTSINMKNQNKRSLTTGKLKHSMKVDLGSTTALYSGGNISALSSGSKVGRSDVESNLTEQTEQDIENDSIEYSSDPYKTIDKVNKEIRNADEIVPVSTDKSNKRRRKAKFVRKMEISDGYVILHNP